MCHLLTRAQGSSGVSQSAIADGVWCGFAAEEMGHLQITVTDTAHISEEMRVSLASHPAARPKNLRQNQDRGL